MSERLLHSFPEISLNSETINRIVRDRTVQNLVTQGIQRVREYNAES